MITKWTNIKSILFELERIIPKDIYQEARLIEDCMRAVDRIGAIVSYQQNVKFIKVEHYKACVPIDCLQIIQVAHKNNFTLGNNDLLSIKEMLGMDDEPLLENSTLPYQVWEASNYCRHNWTPLKLSTNTFAKSVHCDNSVNLHSTCGYEYGVNTDGTMTFNFCEGYICISYYAYPTECDGTPLIPDVEDYKEALRVFCLMTSWELRMNMKEEGASNMYREYKNQWSLFKGKATASIRMPDVTEAQGLQNIMSRLIPKNRRFYNFFSNLTDQENLDMGGFSSHKIYRS